MRRKALWLSIAIVSLVAAGAQATIGRAAPIVQWSSTPSDPYTDEAVTFDGRASTCDVAPCTYTWTDDGPDGPGGTNWSLGTGPVITFTFHAVGTKWVRLTIRNAAGSRSSLMRQISVKQGPRPAPTPTPTPSPTATPTPSPTPTPTGCDLSATPSTFATQVGAASNGQTICLASGSYGTWQGTSKAITIKAAAGATPTMRYAFTTGDGGFTLDGLSGMGGSITDGAHDITIKNSTFTTHATFDRLANSNILFDHNTHNNINTLSGDPNARLGFYWTSATPSGVTIQNSTMQGGDSDGVHTGTAVNVLNNHFIDICADGPNHTDNIQFEGAVGGRIAGNFVDAYACSESQGITSYDSNTHNVLIEDNVVDISRPWGIELYADDSSIVRHNTIVWHPDSGCEYDGPICGQISITHRSTDPRSIGTQVYDNIATVDVSDSQMGRLDHNVNGSGVTFVGPLTTWAGFKLADGSVGENAASDGLDDGARIG